MARYGEGELRLAVCKWAFYWGPELTWEKIPTGVPDSSKEVTESKGPHGVLYKVREIYEWMVYENIFAQTIKACDNVQT